MTDIQTALHFLKTQTWIDLSHDVNDNIPYFSSFSPMTEKTVTTVKEDGFYAKEYSLVTQYGTHVDAPSHFYEPGRNVDQLTLKELVLPLCVIHKEKEVVANNDYAVTLADLLQFEEENGRIPAGCFMAFSSGWSERWNNHEQFYNRDAEGEAHTPGWSLEALKFLHEERDVLAIGHETLDTDSAADTRQNGGLVGELYWLSQDKYQVEVMNNLSRLPATGGAIIIGLPKIQAAPGFNARVFAVVPEE